jgi:Tfp pilus assembly protein PilN
MIKVNLLPQDVAVAGRGAARPLGGPVSGGAVVALTLVLAYVLVSIAGFLVIYNRLQSDNQVKVAQQEHQLVVDKIATLEKNYKDLKTARALYENQLEVLNALDPKERLLWCEKFNLLPQLVPEGVFITRIKVDEEVKEVETAESLRRQQEWQRAGSRGPRPPVVRKPQIRQTLTLEGVAYIEGGQSDRRLELIIAFLNSLRAKEAVVPYTKKSKSFMENFEGQDVTWDPIIGDTVAGREVSRFVFKLKTKPM